MNSEYQTPHPDPHRRTDGQTDGRKRLQYPLPFLKKRGDKDLELLFWSF